jgi:hypothetical protein
LGCLRRARPARKCPLRRTEEHLRHLLYFFSAEEEDDDEEEEEDGGDATGAAPAAGVLEGAAELSLFEEPESLDAPLDLAESPLLSFADEDGLALP